MSILITNETQLSHFLQNTASFSFLKVLFYDGLNELKYASFGRMWDPFTNQ